MSTLVWIILSGLAMSAIALIGAATLGLDEAKRERLILPLVAFSAGSLLGGAFLHMIPEATCRSAGSMTPYLLVLAGFSSSTGTTATARARTAGSRSRS